MPKNIKSQKKSKRRSDRKLEKKITFSFSINSRGLLFIGLLVLLFFGYVINNSSIVDKITQLTCNEVASANLAKKATVLIKTEDGGGSGFFIDSNIIVTNNHVVEDIRKVKISLPDGLETTGEVIGWDNKADIALIKSATNNPVFLRWRFTNLKAGESIEAIGFPYNTEPSFKGDASITKGILSAYRKGLNNIEYVQTDTSINPGSSGGPIIDKCGNIIGVSDSIITIEERTTPVSYGIAKSSAQKSVENIISNPTNTTPEGTLPRFEEQNPIDVVKIYYNLINNQYFKDAYQLTFTAKRRKQLDWEEWTNAFSGVTNVIVKDVEKIDDSPIKVRAKLKLYRTDGFNNLQDEAESIWTLKYNVGYLKLDQLETKTLTTKALFSDEYITNIRKVKVDTESSYSYILSKNLNNYPDYLVSRIKLLIGENLAIIKTIYDKVINSNPLTDEDISNIDVFISRDNEIRTIQKQFEEIDWNIYVNSLWR